MTTIGGIAAKIQYGFTASATDDDADVRFVRITDILGGRVNWDAVPGCHFDGDLSKFQLSEGDLVVARIGASAGTAARIDRDTVAVFASYLVRIQVDRSVADDRFVGFVLRGPAWWDYVLGARQGSAQPQFNAPLIRAFSFFLPPLAEQRAIASVLGALDDKIESNGRLKRLLRSVADTDYVARATTADAVIPLGDLVAVLDRGRAPRYVADGVLVINQKCIRAHEVRFAAARRTDGERLRRDARMVAIGDVLVNSTGVGTLGRAALVEWLPEPEAAVDSHVTIVRAASCKIEPMWVASSLLASEQALVAMSEGSTGQTELSKAKLATLSIPMPTSASRAEHAALASAVADHRGVIQRETDALTALRDTLLPKLVSGQIRVPQSNDSSEALGAAVEAHERQEARAR